MRVPFYRKIFRSRSVTDRARSEMRRRYILSRRNVETVLRALPAGVTWPTAKRLIDAIGQWNTSDDPIPPTLRESWRADGGTVTELERLHAMIRYRRARRSTNPLPGHEKYLQPAVDDLRSFWVTSGHDIAELNQYMADVDAEFPDIIGG